MSKQAILKLNKEYGLIWLLATALILLPMLFFPFNGDHSQFIVAARALSDGGKIFIDFIDLKPPFLYYCYWYITMIFGESEMSCRVFDLIIQLLTYFLLYRLIYKKMVNQVIAGFSIVFYSILYVSLGNQGTFQPAMFIALATVIVFSLQLSDKQSTTKQELINRILAGLVIGLVIGIKYTYGMLLIAVIAHDFLYYDFSWKIKVRRAIVVSVVSFFAFLLTMFPLLDGDVFNGFKQITQVLGAYSARPPFTLSMVKNLFDLLASVFADKYSVLISFASIFAVIAFIRDKEISKKEKQLLGAAIIFTVLLFFSALVEKKCFTYHFVRMFPTWLFLASYGIINIYHILADDWKNKPLINKSVVIIFLIFAVTFSPMLRYMHRLKSPVYYFTYKAKYNHLFSDMTNGVYNHQEALDIADFINQQYDKIGKEKPKLMSVQTTSAIVNYLTPKFKHSKFGQSQFYFSVEAPKQWQEDAYNEIAEADIVLFFNRDTSYELFGHSDIFDKEYSSYSYVFELDSPYSNKIRSTIEQNFELIKTTERYTVYRKI